jgi:hypothetical protein
MKENFKLAQEFLQESGIQGFCEENFRLNLRPVQVANEEWKKFSQPEQDLILRVLEEVLNSSKIVNIRRSVRIQEELFELNKFEIALLTPHRYYYKYAKLFKFLAYAHIRMRCKR